MAEFRYECPETIEAAISILASGDETARIFAGGTDLLVQIEAEVIEPALLVDIKKIAEAREIAIGADEIRVGAAVTGAELGEHDELKSLLPGVVEAVELIGSAQIQGRATVGGNVCNASPAADSVPALIAAGAKAVIAGPDGRREVPVEELSTGPGRTSLAKGELVVSLVLSKPPARSGDAYLRFIPRTEMDIAVVGAGIAVALDSEGACTAARLSLGAVAPTARLVAAAPEILVGKRLDEDTLEALAEAARDACSPIDDKRGTIKFRTKVAGVLARRVAEIAWKRAENQ